MKVLLSSGLIPDIKRNIITEDYGICPTSDFEKEVSDMCNLGMGIYNRGIEKVRKLGVEQGACQRNSAFIRAMAANQLSLDMIRKCSGLSDEEIKEILLQSREESTSPT